MNHEYAQKNYNFIIILNDFSAEENLILGDLNYDGIDTW